jgi:DnaJ domain
VRTRDWATVDFYAVLGVPVTATTDEIGLAFRTLAKQLHPDRVGAAEAESERFKSVTAAYDVLGDERLRRSYDEVRIDTLPPASSDRVTTISHERSAAVTAVTPALAPEVARRRARRWIAGGVVVLLVGALATALIVHLQVGERDRRAGRIKTDATVVVSAARNDLRFTALDGSIVRVPEPDRVNPGTQIDGQRVTVLYRPGRPTDVILDESTIARDITLWVVALKLLVGGTVFLVVGVRRIRRV